MRSRRGWSLRRTQRRDVGRVEEQRGMGRGDRADNRTSKVPPDGGLRSPDVSSRRSPAAEAPPFPTKRAPRIRRAVRGPSQDALLTGGRRVGFNVGKRLRGAVRASESAARALALRRLRRHLGGMDDRQTRMRAKAARPRTRSTQGGDRLREADRPGAGRSAGGARSRGAQGRVRAGRASGSAHSKGRAAQRLDGSDFDRD